MDIYLHCYPSPFERRGGRVVEGACLESKCTFTRTAGSNPALSAEGVMINIVLFK